MSAVVLRGLEVENPLELALGFLRASSILESPDAVGPESFDERDLRLANRWGARISAAEIALVLERRGEIERALRTIGPDATLTAAMSVVPWPALTQLFTAFGEIRGVGFSKMTKALHRKRPALIPMLDSVVQAYLEQGDPEASAPGPFGERAVTFVRGYKRDLDSNRAALSRLRRELERRGYALTEVRILDLLIWSVWPAASSREA